MLELCLLLHLLQLLPESHVASPWLQAVFHQARALGKHDPCPESHKSGPESHNTSLLQLH